MASNTERSVEGGVSAHSTTRGSVVGLLAAPFVLIRRWWINQTERTASYNALVHRQKCGRVLVAIEETNTANYLSHLEPVNRALISIPERRHHPLADWVTDTTDHAKIINFLPEK